MPVILQPAKVRTARTAIAVTRRLRFMRLVDTEPDQGLIKGAAYRVRRAVMSRKHAVAMSRRSTPERIVQARRDAIRNTLTGSGMSLEAAERYCGAWEIDAAGRGLPRAADYWQLGSEWIAAERAARRPGW